MGNHCPLHCGAPRLTACLLPGPPTGQQGEHAEFIRKDDFQMLLDMTSLGLVVHSHFNTLSISMILWMVLAFCLKVKYASIYLGSAVKFHFFADSVLLVKYCCDFWNVG